MTTILPTVFDVFLIFSMKSAVFLLQAE